MEENSVTPQVLDNTGFSWSPQVNELAVALGTAQAKFKVIKKDTDNPFYHSKYADLSSLIDATRQPLADSGLVIIQTPQVDEKTVTVTTILLHNSGQWLKNRLSLPGSQKDKFDAQSVGSAITYARRYAYQAILNIAADEDDDGNAAANAKPESQYKPKPEYNSFSAEAEKDLEAPPQSTPNLPPFAEIAPGVGVGVPKAVIPPELAPTWENPLAEPDFVTKEERTAFVNRLRYIMKTVLPKAGVQNADEVLKNFVKRFTGKDNTKDYTKSEWNKLLAALDNAKEQNKLKELVEF